MIKNIFIELLIYTYKHLIMKTIDSTLYQEVLESHHLTIGDFYFFKNIVIADVREGVHLELKNSQTFFEITNSFFKNKPFGYICNRINKYSVSPLEFANYSKELINVKSFLAIACDSYFDKMNTQIEKHFLQKPFEASNNLEDAFFWTKNQVENKYEIFA